MRKLFEFEEEPCITVSIELDLSYYYHPAKLDDLPENCYPEEEDSEIIPEADYAARIMQAYIAEGRQAIKRFDAKLDEMRKDGTAAEWAKEEQG